MKRLSVWMVVLLLLVAAALGIGLFAKKGQYASDGLVVLNYGDYIAPGVVDMFEEETGIPVIYEEYETPETMYTKYSSHSINYDVICTSDYMTGKLIEEGQVLPLEWENIPNKRWINPVYDEYSASFDPDLRYSVPYFVGTVGILYNSDVVSRDEASSWNILWDEKYRGQIIMENSVRDSLIPALRLNGDSINDTSKKALDPALELLSLQKPLNYAYLSDDAMYEMIMGNANLALIYSGEANAAMLENEALDYEVPMEGSNLWIDSWFIPKSCAHKAQAEAFIDFMCRPDIAYMNWDHVYYTTPNTGVYDMLDEDEQSDEAMFPPNDVLRRCEVFRVLGDDEIRTLQELWKQLKTS